MATDRWERVRQLFGEALEMAPEDRQRFLREACGNDKELHAEIESLLGMRDRATTFLEPLSLDRVASGPGQTISDPRIGTLVGPYRLLRQIGAGGMGEVYEATHDNGQFQMRVAIKFMRTGVSRESIIRRFHAERQTLATLEHANIARLLDGGATPDGAPYIAMEFVEGIRIDEYCDQHRLSITERLRIFRDVCSAVQYAHQHLVVHRDLKPGNILVTTDGIPKLLDFGVAKILGDNMESGAVELTRTGMGFMTLEYASPEQIRGEPVTTMSDVYSLGVLLFKLLTGLRPYRFTSPMHHDITRAIVQDEPLKPSSLLSYEVRSTGEDGLKKIRGRLEGDLDAIVLTALQKEPGRRYNSVEQFSEDLRRHLERVPIRARKDTFAYRAGKFVRRHRVGVALTGFVFAVLLASSIVVFWQASLTSEQRDKAQLEAVKAEQINSFLNDMLSSVDPNTGARDIRMSEILDLAEKRIDRELGDQPEIASSLHLTVGTTYGGLGLYDEAEPHLRKAVEMQRQLHDPSHPQIAVALRHLGSLYYEMGRYDESEKNLRESVLMLRNAEEQDSVSLAESLDALGIVLNNKGQVDSAEASYREALDIYRATLSEGDKRLAKLLNNLAVLLGTRGDYSEAEPLHREALGIMRRVHGNEHPQVAWTLYNLGGVLDSQGKYDRSVPIFQQALEMWRKVVGENHPNVVMCLATLASTRWLTKDYDEAQRVGKEAVEKAESILPQEHPLTAYAHVMLGSALTDGGKPREGEIHLRKGLQIRQGLLPSGHHLVANTQSLLGACLVAQHRFREAEPLLLESYENLKTTFGADHEKTVSAIERVVILYEQWSKPERAAQYRAKALEQG